MALHMTSGESNHFSEPEKALTIPMPESFSPSLRALGSHTPGVLEDTFEKVERHSEGRWGVDVILLLVFLETMFYQLFQSDQALKADGPQCGISVNSSFRAIFHNNGSRRIFWLHHPRVFPCYCQVTTEAKEETEGRDNISSITKPAGAYLCLQRKYSS